MFWKHITTARQAWQKERKSEKAMERNRDEYEFQPGYLEIIERPPAPWTRRTALSLTLLLVLALLWSIIGRLDINARSSGRLLVSSNSKVVQSMELGEVAEIHVRDGQQVKAGDLLISLNRIGVEAQVAELQEQLLYNRLEKARLQALLADNPLAAFRAPDGATTTQVAMTSRHLQSEWQNVIENLESLDSQKGVNRASQKARQQEIKALEKLAGNVDVRLEATRTLVERNMLAKMDFLEQERERLDIDRQLAQAQSTIDVLKAEYVSLQEQRDSYLAKTHRDYFDRLNEIEGTIAIMSQKLIQAQEKSRLYRLRAPVDGVVQQLAVHTRGGVVQPAQQLMVIVPDNQALEAEVMVLNKDVGFVRQGQAAAVKVDAFPYTRYGTIGAEVVYVSRDSVQDDTLGLVFPARLKLAGNTIAVEENQVPLQAGMSITAEIRTGDRRVIDYLLSPLQQYQSEAMRER